MRENGLHREPIQHSASRSSSCSKAAVRSAPTRRASIRRSTKAGSSRIGSSARRSAPKFLQPVEAMLGLVAGDQAGIDGADRGTDDPVRLDPAFVERLIDPRLVGAERTAALEHEDDLEWPRWIGFRCYPFLCIRDVPGFRDIQHPCLRSCARGHLVRCDPPDSVLADPNVRSNHHPPAMLHL